MQSNWLGLVIGNSRLHWASFIDGSLGQTWNTIYCTPDNLAALPPDLIALLQEGAELWLASVVPAQTAAWQALPRTHLITLDQVPLKGMYSTFGIDRALTLWGAITHVGSPALVIDAGTALTFTGANDRQQLVGGGILPGLRLQWQTLHQGTAALPGMDGFWPDTVLPPRWARSTPEAIASGVIYTVLAGLQDWIKDWLTCYPDSQVVMTGGDSARLIPLLHRNAPNLTQRLRGEPDLIFWGIQSVRRLQD